MTHDFTLDYCGSAKVGRPLYIERTAATVTHDQTVSAYVIEAYLEDDFKDWVCRAWDVDQDEIDALGVDTALDNAGIDVRFNEVTA